MSNIVYDKEKVLNIVAEYFYQKSEEEIISLSFENLYSEIVKYASVKHKRTKIPAVSQMCKLIIAELESDKDDCGNEQEILYTKGERFTSKVAYRLKKRYYDNENIYEVLSIEYDVSVYCNTPIICTIKLPPDKVLATIAESYSSEHDKSISWGRVNFIQKLCNKIKKKAPSLIIAVIPEYNRMIYLNKNGKISKETNEFNVVCNSLCVFIKDTPEGHAVVEEFKNSPQSLNEIMGE